jgi:hypothetical protein
MVTPLRSLGTSRGARRREPEARARRARRQPKSAVCLLGYVVGVTLFIGAGCSSPTRPNVETWAGVITVLEPRLCVGRHDATGSCFSVPRSVSLRGVGLNECVVVAFIPGPEGVLGPGGRLLSAHRASLSAEGSDRRW